MEDHNSTVVSQNAAISQNPVISENLVISQNSFYNLQYTEQLDEIHERVLQDIAVKKDRKKKYAFYKLQLEKIQQKIYANMEIQENKLNLYQKLAIIYYDLAKLGDKAQSLEKAIQILEKQKISKLVIVRWKMQLAAMKSSSNKNLEAFLLATEVSELILVYLEEISTYPDIQQSLRYFLLRIIKVIKSQKKNDIIWVHNSQNNIKYFKASLQAELQSLPKQVKQFEEPFFAGDDFHIADFMSLEIISNLNFIQEKSQQAINQVIKQLVIFCSISFFTRATEKYYMKDYSQKYLHFKAIEIALLGFDQTCTYMMFLTKVLIDHFGSKSSQICQQNSQMIMEYNQLRRKMPRDKSEVKLTEIVFADE